MREQTTGLLGDTAARDYSDKLRLFNAFAEPELRAAITGLQLRAGMRVLDAGCGSGESLKSLAEAVGPTGVVVGLDLSTAHCSLARAQDREHVVVAVADIRRPPLRAGSLDLVWSVNVINHLREPVGGVRALVDLLGPGGRIALGQSGFLPDMFFAWDARLERLTNEAVRQYYRERYGVSEQELGAIRALVGLLRRAGLSNVAARTCVIERVFPLDAVSERYLLEAIFRGTWSERLRPYLSASDHQELTRLCDPEHRDFALRRPDFHYLQTLTLVVGQRAQ
jgi:SAM-dependent methyltransferase